MPNSDLWRPTATLTRLRKRAEVLTKIRSFFAARRVLEVDTPTLGHAGATDPALSNFHVQDAAGAQRYLQTSPEFAMKRLLAAGSGDIFQICHAYRREERSRLHLEEFGLLEWYRLGFDHHRLMDEVTALLRAVGFERPIARQLYGELSERMTGLDPHRATTAQLAGFARAHGALFPVDDHQDRALLLDFVFGCGVLPGIASLGALFVYDFPLEQAAYARIRHDSVPIAERFELIIDGIELANGFHEVVDPHEQRTRHDLENMRRRSRNLPQMPIDEALLAAIAHDFPACAGVALGFDRLMMILEKAPTISEVVAFGKD